MTKIKDFAEHIDSEVTIKGWVVHRRSSGKLAFLVMRDGAYKCQAVIEKAIIGEEKYAEIKKIPHESSLSITGKVIREERAPGGYEMHVSDLEVIHRSEEFPITRKEHGPDFLLSNRHLWLRSSRQIAIMKVRDTLIWNVRKFFKENDYMLFDSPIFTTTVGEDSTNLFSCEYFDLGKSYLSQTGQLYLEAAIFALGNVYCFGPTFRAEKSKTRRHLMEFWMVEAEMPFYDQDMNMDVQEQFITYIVQNTIKECEKELVEVLERDLEPLRKVNNNFIRMDYGDAVKFLQERGSAIQWGDDLGAEDETILTEAHDRPIFVVDYPKEAKAFYMKENPENPKVVRCADLLAPEGYGEIIGGSQREEDIETILAAIDRCELNPETYAWYLDLRKYGSVPHSGFGLGIERTLAWICGLKHVRETIPFPRMLYRAYP